MGNPLAGKGFKVKLIVKSWAWELVPLKVGEGPQKYKAYQGGSMATLWGGISPSSLHQPAPSYWRNFSGETYLAQHLAWTDSYEGWEGQYAKLQ